MKKSFSILFISIITILFLGIFISSKENYSKLNREDVLKCINSDLITVSNYLTINDVTILCVDFEESVKSAKKGDFIYFDPPYDSDTSTFNSYTENGFGKEEQKRLSEVFKDLDKRGCYVMLSNYNTKLVKELYKGYNFNYVTAQRNIGASAKNRGTVEEVIITNYKNKEGFDK